jgi:nucleotide-binding universal stress UspA family protein
MTFTADLAPSASGAKMEADGPVPDTCRTEVHMLSIRTVLCPVDLSPASTRHVDVAAGIARAFGARLILHHNLVEVGIGSGVGWMWAPRHPGAEQDAEEQLRQLLVRVPDGTTAEMRITRGRVLNTVASVARSVGADLIVLTTHSRPSGQDDSVAERLLKRATLPIFAIHEQWHERHMPQFESDSTEPQAMLVPTDLTHGSQAAMRVAFDLARRFHFHVHLLHVLRRGSGARAAERARARVEAAVLSEAPHGPQIHVESGPPAQVIARVAREISAACIVMGERERSSLLHWFRTDTAQGVLHPAPCPIWYVPEFPLPASVPATDATAASASDGNAGEVTRVEQLTGVPHRLVEELRDTDFHYWPASHVYGVVDSLEDAEAALADLLVAGMPRSALHTWHGPLGKDSIDPSGERHGRAARIWRTLERATPERDLLDRYGAEVEQGHVCIGARCGSRETQQVVAALLARHRGHLITYFSMGAVEQLTA